MKKKTLEETITQIIESKDPFEFRILISALKQRMNRIEKQYKKLDSLLHKDPDGDWNGIDKILNEHIKSLNEIENDLTDITRS